MNPPPKIPAVLEYDTVIVTDNDLDTLKTRIAENLVAYYPHLADRDTRVTVQRYPEVSSYPLYGVDVFVEESGEPAVSIVVKFAPVLRDNNEGLTEYKHLKLIWENIECEKGPIRVPRPLDFYEDLNALLTERVPGERFSRALLRNASRGAAKDDYQRMTEGAALCGQWLRAFHDLTEKAQQHPFDSGFVDDVNTKLELFESFGFPRQASKRLKNTVRELSTYGKLINAPLSGRHGDYGPQNVHIGDGFVYVFDLNYHTDAIIYDDIDYFLVTLETLNPYPKHVLFDRKKVMALRNNFLAGYFGPDNPLTLDQRILLEGYYLKSLLFRCAKQRRNVSKKSRLMRRVFDLTRIRSYYPKRLKKQCERIEVLLHQDRYEVGT